MNLQLPEMKLEQEALAAVKYVKEFYPHRIWLIRNKIDFTNFPEELQFQDLNEMFDIEFQALKVKFTKALFYATNKKA